ncbi:hypothetical protein ACOMHN_003999 [Nucella lapillus]
MAYLLNLLEMLKRERWSPKGKQRQGRKRKENGFLSRRGVKHPRPLVPCLQTDIKCASLRKTNRLHTSRHTRADPEHPKQNTILPFSYHKMTIEAQFLVREKRHLTPLKSRMSFHSTY